MLVDTKEKITDLISATKVVEGDERSSKVREAEVY